jgi:hypothetical protein
MRIRGLFVGTLLVLVATAGCGDMWGDLFGSKRSAVDPGGGGGTCTRDDAALTQVILNPPACGPSLPCICGSYCSSTINGVCVVDCRSDAECATGKTCSQFGQCIGAGSSDGGVPANPACPRNEALLDQVVGASGGAPDAGRHCEFDDICPYGSYCDRNSGQCSAQCRTDEQCMATAQPGQTLLCDCLGKCVEPSAPKVPPATALPALEVTPTAFNLDRPADITAPNWGNIQQRSINVALSSTFLTQDSMGHTSGPAATITFTPGPNLTVECPGGSASAAACTIAIDPATFARVGASDNYRTAPVTVIVRPAATTTSVESWELSVTTTQATASPQAVRIRYLTPSMAPAPMASFQGLPNVQGAPVVPLDYRGIGTLNLTSPTGDSFDVPVKARADGSGHLVLRDDTQLLSPSGTLVVTTDNQLWLDPNVADRTLGDNLDGTIEQAISNISLAQDSVSGAISGTFGLGLRLDDVINGSTLDFSRYVPALLTLRNASALESGTCASSTDCASGTRCDGGFCSSSPDFHLASGVAVLFHKQAQAWTEGSEVGSESDQFGFLQLYAPSLAWAQTYVGDPLPQDQTQQLVTPPLTYSGDMRATFTFSDGSPAVYYDSQGNLHTKLKPLAIPMFAQRDEGGTAKPVSEMLSKCVEELRRSPPDGYHSYELGSYLDAPPEGPIECIDLGRFFITASPGTATNHALAQNLLRQWLELHSFIGREALEENALNDVLSSGESVITGADSTTSTTSTPPPKLPEVLSAVESGLGLLLYNMPGALIQQLTSDELNAPDYRTHALFGSPTCSVASDCNSPDGQTMDCGTDHVCQVRSLEAMPQHNQPVGLPATMMETATSYLKVLDAYVSQVERQTYGQPTDQGVGPSQAEALSRYGIAMRVAMSIESLAYTLRVKSTDGPCTGLNCAAMTKRWESARDEFYAARRLVMQKVATLRANVNPLGIPEDDIPLYFGDPSGTNSQYFAGSDYLLSGWAAPAVKTAQDALAAARDAWIAQRQSLLQDELNQHNRQNEIDTLKSKYGQPILDNCGALLASDANGGTHSLESRDVVDYFQTHPFSSDTCFVNPTCVGTDGVDGRFATELAFESQFLDVQSGALLIDRESNDTVVDRTVRQEMCRFDDVNLTNHTFQTAQAFSVKMYEFCDIADREYGKGFYFDKFHTPTATCRAFKSSVDGHIYITNSANPTPQMILPLAALVRPIAASELGPGNFYSQAGVPTRDAYYDVQIRGTDDNIYAFVDHRSQPAWEHADLYCATGHQVGSAGVVADPTRGSYTSEYDFLLHPPLPAKCFSGKMGVAYYEGLAAVLRIQKAKRVVDAGKGAIYDIGKQCEQIDSDNTMLDQVQKDLDAARADYDNLDWFLGSFASGLNSVGAWGSGFAHFVTLAGDDVNDEQARFNELSSMFSRSENARACWDNWAAHRRDVKAALTDVDLAVVGLNEQYLVLKNLIDDNNHNLMEGQAAIKREEDSPLSSVGHHYWLDEKVERFKKELEWSRRLTFLAMRAVEWEFQQSLPYRAQIVSAVHPDQLEDVVRGLQQEQAARTINRRRPAESGIVLSLRDDILSVTDRSSDAAGERAWTPAQRFEGRLGDDRYAYYDKNGNYLGQAVPFNLGVTGVLETRCGERLWRTTATIQGDGLTESTPGAPILLLKKNTFASQFCMGKGDGQSTMQIGMVHPSAQLFNPGSSIDPSDSNDFTAAMMFPWFNITRTEFYKDTYRDGASEELAGRGLYGDYVLLFPKQLLDEGFGLDKVEDVLLRFDYLSVDNLPQ